MVGMPLVRLVSQAQLRRAFAMFLVVQAVAKLQRIRQKEADVEEVAEETPVEVALLTEIRDLMKTGRTL